MTTYERKAMLPPIVITGHARQAMMLRRVSMDEVLEALRHPEVTNMNSNGDKRFFRDQICVVTTQMPRGRKLFVKTVLYRYGDQWTDKDVRERDLRK